MTGLLSSLGMSLSNRARIDSYKGITHSRLYRYRTASVNNSRKSINIKIYPCFNTVPSVHPYILQPVSRPPPPELTTAAILSVYPGKGYTLLKAGYFKATDRG
jgi:hypothetical protein